MNSDSVLQSSAIASELINEQQLDYALRVCRYRLGQQGLPKEGPIPDRLLAEVLVEQEALTAYQADQLLAGQRKFKLGPYLITDWIGQGGMGQVFKGIHQVMGRECAVKVLPLTRATQDARDAFAREIQMQAKLDCPYLVRAFDAGQEGRVHYLVTEYVPGMDLRRLVKSRGPLTVQQAAKIVMQAALGLEYAHEKGLVHRDVKPGNILVTPGGDAKVSDVGLAGFAKDLVNDPRAGKIVGTPDYLSPEQIRTPLDIRPASDIYSLGCTLYYAICGKVPYPGGGTESKLQRHLREFPLHPRNFAPDITEDFVDIIVDMMEKNVERRIASAAEVAARLEPWAVDALSVSTVSMTRSPWLAPPPPTYAADRAAHWDEDSPSSFVQSVGTSADGQENTSDQPRSGDTLAQPNASDSAVDLAASTPNRNRLPNIGDAADEFEGPHGESSTSRDKQSVALVVALTAAILIPPALLVGAILGYLAAQ